MKTSQQRVRAPGPAVVVECPWCAAPVEIGIDADAISCPDCRVTVELAPPERKLASHGSVASAA